MFCAFRSLSSSTEREWVLVFLAMARSWVVEDGRRASSAIEASRSEGGKVEDFRAEWKVEGTAPGLGSVDVSCAVNV